MNEKKHEDLSIDMKKGYIEHFNYSHDWIKRHKDCEHCGVDEWKDVAISMSNSIQSYLKWMETSIAKEIRG